MEMHDLTTKMMAKIPKIARNCESWVRRQETGSAMPTIGLERATHPLPRPGVPLHHRTKELPQSECHILSFCAKSQIIAAKPITSSPKAACDSSHLNYRKLWSLHMEIQRH